MEITITKKLLVVPVNEHAREKKILFFASDGTIVFEMDVPLDGEETDYKSYVDVSSLVGRTVTVRTEPETAWNVEFADEAPDLGLYRERYRPSLHYTAKRGWVNDPNGLFYANGVYHMFYQYNPASGLWGNMSWGHATSFDLVHWEEREVALRPDEMGTMFSGSAFVDTENASGLKSGALDPILFFYTAAGGASRLSHGKRFTQCLAYSLDNGKTFVKYEKNPIIPHVAAENRDPKVVWSPELGRYVLALYLKKHEYALFTSQNLLDWTEFQRFVLRGDDECPDIYPLIPEDAQTEDGNEAERLWIFSGACDTYAVGRMTQNGFEEIQGQHAYHIGAVTRCSYAAQTFTFPDAVAKKGVFDRRIKVAWDLMHAPHSAFENQLGFPTEVTLARVHEEYRLRTNPVREIEGLVEETKEETNLTVTGRHPYTLPLHRGAYEVWLTASFAEGTGGQELFFSLFGVTVHVLPSRNLIRVGANKIPLTYTGNGCEIRVLVDTLGIELFADGGLIYSTAAIPADYTLPSFTLWTRKEVKIDRLSVRRLANIWEK